MKSVIEYLEESSEKYPEKIAVKDDMSSCTYLELNIRAKEIGSFLGEKNVQRKPVVCFMEKGVKTLNAFMGIVYAGAFYTLLDPTFPEERIKQILDVLEPEVILSTYSYHEEIRKISYDCKAVYLEDIPHSVNQEILRKIRKRGTDMDPLYCNFTSGSTGVPKGVLVCHRSVIDFTDVFTKTFGLTENDVIGNQAPFDFDVSVKDIYSSLKLGATLVIIPKSYFMFPVKVVEMLDENRVTTLIWAVSALCMLVRLHGLSHRLPGDIKTIMFSGEVMPIKQLNQWRKYYPHARFINLYGPTEITCNCTYHILKREYMEGDKIPIGIPFDNERVFLLDKDETLIEDGKVGELCVSGTTLALGYYNNDEMTKKNFVQNPLNRYYPELIYKTGDLARWEKGELIFAGRKDFQIKHMGHRIELEEIEAVINGIPNISHVCCFYSEEENKIVAYYIGNTDRVSIISEMKKYVPEYMIPNIFIQTEYIPLTKNGKTDRKELISKYMKEAADGKRY